MNKESDKGIRNLIDTLSKNLSALKVLGEKTDEWDTLIIYIASAKLDTVTLRKWEEFRGNESPTLNDFYSFLRQRAEVLETINQGSSSAMSSATNKNERRPSLNKSKHLLLLPETPLIIKIIAYFVHRITIYMIVPNSKLCPLRTEVLSQKIEHQLTKFWELDDLPSTKFESKDNEYCEQLFNETTKRLNENYNGYCTLKGFRKKSVFLFAVGHHTAAKKPATKLSLTFKSRWRLGPVSLEVGNLGFYLSLIPLQDYAKTSSAPPFANQCLLKIPHRLDYIAIL
ncbi:hypothetical protein NE865_09200 [Phthorimaea operculella]|nr:hypothetical protein NE865_09200 [Phthorimaea operculella]